LEPGKAFADRREHFVAERDVRFITGWRFGGEKRGRAEEGGGENEEM
jgi:hypothetical protein